MLLLLIKGPENSSSLQLSTETSLTVFRTIIQPHFDYCASLLYLLNSGCVASLQKLLNRAMRIVLKCSRYTPIRIMIDVLGLLNVRERLFYFAMIFIFKILQGCAPSYFSRFIVFQRQVHNYLTRHGSDFYVRRTKYRGTMNSPFHRSLIVFNGLPVVVRSAASLAEFKRRLLGYIHDSRGR